MFETLIIKPIFNVLVFIYAIIPGGDFGIAVILFTILVRIALWPMLKKNLHQSRLMRELQPEVKKIKERAKGDRQKESMMLMELYKEKGVKPFSSIGVLLVQLPVLWGLFRGLRELAANKQQIIDLSYGFIHNIGNMQAVVENINNFDERLLGIVDLTRNAFGDSGLYVPALVLALLAAIFQFYQSKALMPKPKDARGLRQILKDEANGKKTDQSEINAAVGRNARFLFPALTFFFAASVPGALALYWAVGSLVGVIQQRSVLKQDVEELEEIAEEAEDKPASGKKQPSKRKRKKR